MKKVSNFWVLAIVLALCLGFSSCKPDISKLIIGKWKVVESSESLNSCEFQSWMEFKSERVIEFDACDNSTDTGVWTVGGTEQNVVSMVFDDDAFVWKVESITRSEMVVVESHLGTNTTLRFKRIQ